MLDVCLGATRPAFSRRGTAGCFPIVAWRQGGAITWGVEAVMLSAGTNVEWLVEDLGILPTHVGQRGARFERGLHRRGHLRAGAVGSRNTTVGLRGPRRSSGCNQGDDGRTRHACSARRRRQPGRGSDRCSAHRFGRGTEAHPCGRWHVVQRPVRSGVGRCRSGHRRGVPGARKRPPWGAGSSPVSLSAPGLAGTRSLRPGHLACFRAGGLGRPRALGGCGDASGAMA